LIQQSKAIPVSGKVSSRLLNALRKKYGLLGQALAHEKLVGFINRLREGMDAEKETKEQEKQETPKLQKPLATESQYKSPTGAHVRRQSMYPGSVDKSRSFGGVVDSRNVLNKRLDEAFKSIDTVNEEIAVRSENDALLAEAGRFIVDKRVAMSNHADILKVLVLWLQDNRPEVMRSAVESMADMVRSGTIFRK